MLNNPVVLAYAVESPLGSSYWSAGFAILRIVLRWCGCAAVRLCGRASGRDRCGANQGTGAGAIEEVRLPRLD
jgi:hypothetical protein